MKKPLSTATEVSDYKALVDLYTFESFIPQELKCRAATQIDLGQNASEFKFKTYISKY